MALALITITSLLGLGVMQTQSVIRERMHKIRIKAHAVSLENRLRSILAQPLAYQGCSVDLTQVTCTLNNANIAPYLSMKLQGSPCVTGADCRVEIENLQFTQTSRTVSFDIAVKGAGDRFKNIPVNIKVPDDVLQANNLNCGLDATGDGTRPVFKGFSASGAPICDALPKVACADQEFITGIDPTTGGVLCATFPSGPVGCPAGQKLISVDWQGGASVVPTCQALPDPYDVFGGGDEGLGTGSYSPPSYASYVPPTQPAVPAHTPGAWGHESWGANSGNSCPGVVFYGTSCSAKGMRCDQFHFGLGMETLSCQ